MSTATRKRDDERRALMLQSGTRLFEAAPFIFPDHAMMAELNRVRRELHEARKENDTLREQLMGHHWKSCGPVVLRRAMKACNDSRHHCNCLICAESYPVHRVVCRFWERFEWYMTNCGITWVVVRSEDDDVDEIGTNADAVIPGVPSSVMELPLVMYPVPPGFNRRTSCTGMLLISHINTHLVFRRVGRVLAIFYGRRLWEEKAVDGPEVRKLNLLLARLRVV